MKVRWRMFVLSFAIPVSVALAFDPKQAPLPSATDFSATLLPERADIVSWRLLAQVTSGSEKGKVVPVFADAILALDKTDVKVQGFIVPIESDPKQKHFVLSAVPMSCPFCMPAGPEAMVEVRLKEGIEFSEAPIVVAGKFAVTKDDPRGVFYSVTDGVAVSAGSR